MIRPALAVSAALHLGAAALLLPWPNHTPPAEAPMVEVEMVQEPDAVAGAAPETAASEVAPQPEQAVPPGPDPGPAPAQPAPPAPAARPQATAVNLGGAAQDMEGLLVTGPNVVPPRPDAVFHNRPPHYPRDAARRGEHGTVTLVVHVMPDGTAEDVLVAASSGSGTLDQAARDAVLLWRFTPALAHGAAVPYDYNINIKFIAGTTR